MHGASVRWIGTVNTAKKCSMRSGLVDHFGAIAGRMACILAATLLACASLAHGQVVEEGGFPVKGNGVSGESFSLSCPPRLVVQAGESVLFSCTATAVPEEGVHYGWEALSGDGFHFLSASDELSPLFTAPVSGGGAEYVYRLTAMSAGVYETVSLAVVVERVPGDIVQDRDKSPGLQEECDPFTVPDELGEGCLEGKAPDPFGFGPEPEGEFVFPEAPGLPDRPSGPVRGGAFDRQAPPRLECPVAVFLEELETGAIECHAWDVSGEEYLEYSWEPVGSTTRDYLDNPRLIPENAPNPSVVAPEAPVYETLESFRSGETTFRYRYRLTATSRATGLSSSQEVEVYVSSSRPSVYCPLEVVVEEGETIALDCEGVDPLSFRMDYDEDEASVLWEWEGLWGTSMAPLAATHLSSPLFTAPLGSAGEEYHYIASMTTSASGAPRTARRRVTVKVSEGEAGAPIASDDTLLDNGQRSLQPSISCTNEEVFEGESSTIDLECTIEDNPGNLSDWTWEWDEYGSTPEGALSAKNVRNPTFTVLPSVSSDKNYIYEIIARARINSQNLFLWDNQAIRVTVKERPDITVTCESSYDVDEGTDDIEFDCSASGGPGDDDSQYTWSWSPTTNLTSGTDTTATPTFDVPGDVDRNTAYTYTATVSAANADDGTATVTVTVRTTSQEIDMTCIISRPTPHYEGSGDLGIDCRATHNRIPQSDFKFKWTHRGDTPNTDLLEPTDEAKIIFKVPGDIPQTTVYTYTLKTWADTYPHIDPDYLDFTFRVFNKRDITVTCEGPYDVAAGDLDIELECEADGALGDDYTWSWSPTTNLTGHASGTPTFEVPDVDDIDQDTTYTYTVTATADNADDGTATVKVTVREPFTTAIHCPGDPYSVNEGSDRYKLDCRVDNPPTGVNTDYQYTSPNLGREALDLFDFSSDASPIFHFTAPDTVDADKTYDYRFTISVGHPTRKIASEEFTVTVLDTDSAEPSLTCTDSKVYEDTADIMLDCTVENEPTGATYAWTARGSTSGTDDLNSTTILTPTFNVPDDIPGVGVDDYKETYEYTVTLSAGGADVASADITVKVLEKPDIVCEHFRHLSSTYEGTADKALFEGCISESGWKGAPGANPVYTYAWTAWGSTPDTRLLSAMDIETPTFYVPDTVDEDETYSYKLTVSAENADDFTKVFTVTVKNYPHITVTCEDSSYDVDEGDADIEFNCSASGVSGDDPQYTWSWSPTAGLTGHGTNTPTFAVPGNVDKDTTYTYTVTASADIAFDGTAEVTVMVRDTAANTPPPSPVVTCSDSEVYEGAAHFALDCSVTNEPSGATYAWTANTADAPALTNASSLTPTFTAPADVDADTDYDYTVTMSASGINDVTEDVTVTVLNKPPLTLVCRPAAAVYEGAADFALDCVASGAPPGSDYNYVWTPRGSTVVPGRLSSTTIAKPTFDVPEEVSSDETYEYTLTVSADNAESATEDVTVRVLDKRALSVVCATPSLVYEGSADFVLDCVATGAPEGSEYDYVWTPRGSTSNTDLLIAGTDGPTPTFAVPDGVDEDETYEYLLTVSAENAIDATAAVTVRVLNPGSISLICASPPLVYEGGEDIAFDCTISYGGINSFEPSFAWSGSRLDLLSDSRLLNPIFYVPDEVESNETYEYTLTAWAVNVDSVSVQVVVTVLNRGTLDVACAPPPLVYEGSADFDLDCSVSGAPAGSEYRYVWEARGDTQDTSLLSATDVSSPTFDVPDEVDQATSYEYMLTVGAENAESATAFVMVTVLNRGALSVACTDPGSVYEGSADITLDCTVSAAPAGSNYTYAWTVRGNTSDTSLLSATDVASPVFYVPDEVDQATSYEYMLTVGAENAESATAFVTVTVLNRGALSVACTDPGSVYEGSADFDLDCSVSGAPAGSEYRYVWEARGDTQDTSLLSATDVSSPTFDVPDEVDQATSYEYMLTVGAENAESATAFVTVTVLNRGALSVACTDPGSVYEGSADITLDCTVSGAPAGSEYRYVWEARGDTQDTSLLSATDVSSPTFDVPDEVTADETYEYTLTVSADNAESATADVLVTVLNHSALSVVCTDRTVYEGSLPFRLECTASGGPPGVLREWDWSPDTHLTSPRIRMPVFTVPANVEQDVSFTYTATVTAGSMVATGELTVTVLNRSVLSVVCTAPGSVYEGSDDVAFDCEASGAPAGSDYTYAWTARGDAQDTSLLSATDIKSPIFYVPDEVNVTTTYEYLLTVSAANAEDATAEVAVTVLDRVLPPPPVSHPPVISPPVAEEVTPDALLTPSALGVTVSASPLIFGVQSSDTAVLLDPMTDGISTYISGPYHAGRMTLSLDGSEGIAEVEADKEVEGDTELAIELASPVLLKRADAIEASSLIFTPVWSYAESCEQLSSQTIGGLYTEVTLSESDCRLLRFGGELDLTDVPSGWYTGNLDVILRSGESEETFAVEVDVTVLPARRVITIGPGGVRFSTSRELPAGLTEEQNLSIYPHVAFLTEEKPNGSFELSNPSLIPLEVSVSARFGYTEATENGREVVVEDASGSRLGDLSEVVDIHPNVLVLMPGEKGLVRYGVQEGALAAMAEQGYAAFFDVVSEPRQYVRSDQMPEEVTGDRTARVTMRVPGVYVPGEGASQLRATLLSLSFVSPLSATFLLETQDHPFVGEVVAYDGDGRELGRRETLVYTRSRVRIPLDRMPEEGAVFLRFSPRGSGRAPDSAPVRWDAPRRDIGASEDKDRATTSQVLVHKP